MAEPPCSMPEPVTGAASARTGTTAPRRAHASATLAHTPHSSARIESALLRSTFTAVPPLAPTCVFDAASVCQDHCITAHFGSPEVRCLQNCSEKPARASFSSLHRTSNPPRARTLSKQGRSGIIRSVGAWRSPVSALQWGCRGRRFESVRPDHRHAAPDEEHGCGSWESRAGAALLPFPAPEHACSERGPAYPSAKRPQASAVQSPRCHPSGRRDKRRPSWLRPTTRRPECHLRPAHTARPSETLASLTAHPGWFILPPDSGRTTGGT
jgi:hypothetical protein